MNPTNRWNVLYQTHISKNLLLSVFSILLIAFCCAQTPVQNYTIVDVISTPQSLNNIVNGYPVPPATTTNFGTDRTYNVNYGARANGNAGINRQISGFSTATNTYTRLNSTGGSFAFNKVVFNRKDPVPGYGAKFTALYEFTNLPNGSKLYLEPSAENTMEGFMNSFSLNKGTDNVFNNKNTEATFNNIERIDLLYTSGITTSVTVNLAKIGFLLNDRGGNDNFKVSPILGIDENGVVNSLGPLVSVTSDKWGKVGPNINTVVIQKDANNSDYRPSEIIATQQVGGVFISLANLNIGINTTIYGLSIFPYDQPDNSTEEQLLTLSNAPLDTDENNGGLDLLSGNFVAQDITVATPSLTGHIYHDPDGLNGSPANTINGVGIGSPASTTPIQQLYANLLDIVGNVVLTTSVNSDGTFIFPAVNPGNYSIQITTIQGVSLLPAPPTQLPENWGYIGEYNGTGAGSDGMPNGILPNVVVNIDNVTTPKFGIELRPESNNQILNINDKLLIDVIYSFPNLSKQFLVPALSGTDPEDKPASTNDSISTGGTFIVTTLPPANEAVLYYDNVELVTGIPIVNYDPAKLQIKFLDIGLTSTSFHYTILDAANLEDLTPALYQINFLTVLPSSKLKLSSQLRRTNAVLLWEAQLVNAVDVFEIQTSINGVQYQKVGTVLPHTSASSEKSYVYTHSLQDQNEYFFRIMARLKNGEVLFSNIVKANLSGKLSMNPNPAKGSTILSGLIGNNTIHIVDVYGKLLQSFSTNNTSFEIPTKGMYPGIYWIKISQNNKTLNSLKLLIE
jgi:hypothetical protein